MDAMKSSHDEIALQGIEFWSNVCDEEYELQLLQQEVRLNSIYFSFVKHDLKGILKYKKGFATLHPQTLADILAIEIGKVVPVPAGPKFSSWSRSFFCIRNFHHR